MRTYQRANIPGATYFLTFNLADRHANNLLVEHIEVLRLAFARVHVTWPFTTHAIVVLPEHIHWLVELPEEDADFSTRVRLIKTNFSRNLPKTESIHPSRIRKNERGIWQRRFWEHVIRDELDFNRHMDYVHFNPVKHGHVARARDWPFSSFHRCVERGLYDVDWGDSDEPIEVAYD
jgi:putative transposase